MSLPLRSGGALPSIGRGCWKLGQADTSATVLAAIRGGYRHLDCACDYGNEREVGEGIAAAITEGIVTRADLWVTSKLWCTYHSPEHVEAALARTLADLQLSYLDLWLIHFPIPLQYVPMETRYPPSWRPADDSLPMTTVDVPLIDTWRAMVALAAGAAPRVRHLGVCNMTTSLLADLMRACAAGGLPQPEVLQVELVRLCVCVCGSRRHALLRTS